MATAKLTKYRVHQTNLLDPTTGKKVGHGGVISLDSKLAKRFNDLGYLRPYIEENDAEATEEVEGAE